MPTSGTVSVNGILPYRNRKENAQNIGIVFGQRSQLNWDLPMEDTFQLYKQMYHIDDKTFQKKCFHVYRAAWLWKVSCESR